MSVQFVKGVLYRMKRQYGIDTIFIRRQVVKPNPRVGNIITTEEHFKVKMIRLPDTSSRSIIYSVIFNNIKHGGSDMVGIRSFIIDSSDLPEGYTPDESDFIRIGDAEYQIKKLDELDDKLGYYVTARRIGGVNE